jgi:hypothetical protein
LKLIYDIYDENYNDIDFLQKLLILAECASNWKDEIRAIIVVWRNRTDQRHDHISIHQTTMSFLEALSAKHEYLKSIDPALASLEKYSTVMNDTLDLLTDILADYGERYPFRIH